jgi:hypothetical protein
LPDRRAEADAFCACAGWGGVPRGFLAGDASARRYERLRDTAGQSAVLMDAPPWLGEDVGAFLKVDAHLRHLGLSAPNVLAADDAEGFVLLEDLGDDLFARLLARDPAMERPLYTAATDVLVTLQAHPPMEGLPVYDAAAMAAAISPAFDWYLFAATAESADQGPICGLMADLLARNADAPPCMILRDYHAENLIWLPDRQAEARVGLLDFQQAMLSHPAFDLVSLLQDARRDVAPATQELVISRFIAATGCDSARFRAAYALIGAQRHLRILGVFTRLSLHFGKSLYVDLIPRVWRDLWRDLSHPTALPLARRLQLLLPKPTPALLRKIKDQCGTIPTP